MVFNQEIIYKVITSDFGSAVAMMSPDVRISLLMDVTNLCDYNCAICYKTAGNLRFSMQDFTYIVQMAAKYPRCQNEILGITGGEPAMLYTYFKTHDLRDMIQCGFDNDFNVVIKTNAGWTRGDMADLIWNDIDNLNFENQKFGIDLSLSIYHQNAIDTTNRVLKHVCNSDKLAKKTRLELLCAGSDSSNLDVVLSKQNLDSLGLKITDQEYFDKSVRGAAKDFVKYKINDTDVDVYYNGNIVRVGNAKRNNLGNISRLNNLSIVKYPLQIWLWFDAYGNVHIANKHKPRWTTQYKDKSGKIKSMDTIIEEFTVMLYNEALKRVRKSKPEIKNPEKIISLDFLKDFIPYYQDIMKKQMDIKVK